MSDQHVLVPCGQTIGLLSDAGIKCEIHSFPSGIKMVDIWHKEKFFVLQFEKTSIGISEINQDNPGFDIIPDQRFYHPDQFRKWFENIIIP